MMKKILFVGEHPLCGSGNGNMMAAVLSQVNLEKYQITCFAADIGDKSTVSAFRPFPFSLIDAQSQEDDWGSSKLLRILQTVEMDAMVMVGIDIWQYAHIFPQINEIRKQQGFKWVAIFPYDLQQLRSDWVKWINMPDYPYVYSRYGFEMLKDHVSGVRYFRPPLNNAELFKPMDKASRIKIRREFFKTFLDNDLIFGFVGVNCIRKDIPRFIKALIKAKQEVPNIKLYLHVPDFNSGVYNLYQMARDYGGKDGDLSAKQGVERTSVLHMIKIYNSMDCLVNCTMQEGLSWTPLEAMLCGIPVIASDTTAQTELVEGAGLLVPCEELAYVPVLTGAGRSFVDAKACSVDAIRDAIITVAKDADLREKMRDAGSKKAREWLKGVSDINDLLVEATKPKSIMIKINKILFMQHSSAGDVLMSTQCFKGIKERHKGMELCYMTQPQYADIVEGNPFVDEIVSWDPQEAQRYEIIYNPHGKRILPGNFNSGDVPLHAMYPYFCRVEADDIFVEQIKPSVELPGGDYIVIQSSGGAEELRTYKHMDLVLKKLDLPVIHIGSTADMACHEAAFDFRGKLSWRETAWVMARAKAAIVMDSAPAHLAGALGTYVIVLYGPAPARVTGPKANSSKVINLEPNWLDVCPIVAACYGKGGCSSPCINSINPLVVRKALLSLIEKHYDNKND